MSDVVGSAVVELFAEVDESDIRKAADDAGDTIDREFSKSVDGIGDTISREIAGGVEDAAGRTKRSVDDVRESAGNVDTEAMGFRDTLTGVEDTLGGISELSSGNIFEGLFTLGAGIGDLASGVENFIGPAISRMQDFELATAGAAAKQKIATAATKVWSGIQAAFNAVMAANPIALVVLAIAALVAAVVLAYKNSETFRRIVDAAWTRVQEVIAGFVDWFRETALPFIQAVLDGLKTGFRTARDAVAAVWDAIQAAIDGVVAWFRDTAWPAISAVIDLAKAGFEGYRDLVVAVWEKVTEVVQGVIEFFTDTVGPAISGFIDSAKGFFDDLRDRVVDIVEDVRSEFDDIIDFFGEAPGKIKDSLEGMFAPLWDGFKGAVNRIIDGWNGLSFTFPGIDLPGERFDVGAKTVSTPDVPRLAEGGIVDDPTLAIVGESGPEAVIPLDRVGDFGGGSGINIEAINVTTRHQRQIARQVSTELSDTVYLWSGATAGAFVGGPA